LKDSFFSINQLKSILKDYNLRLTKRFGQNFLIDRNKALQILKLMELSLQDKVVEIGAGIGTMTFLIAERVSSVTAFEIDRGFLKLLNEYSKDFSNVQIIGGDFLKVAKIENFPEKVKVYSSLPYNSAVKILIRLAEFRDNIERLVVLLPEEIVKRAQAEPSSKEYGVFTIFFSSYYKIEPPLIKVERNLFFPSPDVDSKAMLLKPLNKKEISYNPEDFISFVSKFFQKRRKTLRNILNDLDLKLDNRFYNLDLSVRPEDCSLDFYKNAYNFFLTIQKKYIK